jgi:hypothetical protein
MNQMSDPIHPPGGGSGSGPGTGKPACSPFRQSRSQFKVSVASNPFTDSHAISTLTNVPVEDLDRVEMSTYHVETTDGRLSISFKALQSILTRDQRQLSSWTWLLKISLSSTLSLLFRPRPSPATGQTGKVRYLLCPTTY